MSIHKLTAGDGYSYLTRQVAALDVTERGYSALADYYSQQGESPGQWLGSALGDVDLSGGDEVTEEQMASLFGEGKHPNADRIMDAARAEAPMFDALSVGRSTDRADRPATMEDAQAAIRLGQPFAVIDTAPEFQVALARACAQANLALGMPKDTPLAAAQRARIRTDVGRQMFVQEYGRPARNPRELSSFIARHSRAATTAVAGFDLTFTPVKSVSALWAIAPPEVATLIEAAHHAAVQDTLSWLEKEVIRTRGGRNGVQQLDTTGMIAAAFDHRDSRAEDPDLHTHVAVSSKVRVLDAGGTPGRWLALDGRVLFKATVTASERYNTRVEAELHRRLGLTFGPRSDAASAAAAGKRGIREVAGVPEELLTAWSTRRAQIDVRRAQLSARFQADHGRPPTPVEVIKLAQQATLETRDAKHGPRSEAQQRAQWRAEAAQVLGSEKRVDRLVRSVTGPPVTTVAVVHPEQMDQIVAVTQRVLESRRSTWQVWHVRSEAERQARSLAPAGTDVDALVDQVVATVLAEDRSVPLGKGDPVDVPDLLRRRDGVSVYEVTGSRLYTSTTVLADEAFLVETAALRGGRVVADVDVDLALLESVANGVTLNTAQAHLVHQIATSGARLQLAIAPAGSGKTTAMAALTAAWTGGRTGPTRDNGHQGTVLGLAPSAVAAAILGQETGTHADTLAKLVYHLDRRETLPHWAEAVDENTLIIIDEAGMAATGDLAAVTRFALERGASVRLVGDDRQLAAIAAGGVLRDIQATVGAVSLCELIRFRDQAEAAAGLAIRTGDTAGLGFYIDQDRVHVGDLTTVTDHAYTAWSTDRAAGLDSIMLAPTRELATGLNIRARTDRLTRLNDVGCTVGQETTLADGASVSGGDTIITRRNDRRLRTSVTDFVKNGDRWTVTVANDDRSLDVVHTQTGRRLRLPSDYVAQHVQLGYATTVHGGQGVTADTSHTVTSGTESRQQLYVALTRGREGNHLYLVTAMDGDEHSVITPAATHPLTAINVLEQILARDEAEPSATTTARRLGDPATNLTAAAARYHDSLHTGAVHTLGPGWSDRLDTALENISPRVTHSPAYPTLSGHLALIAVDGYDPVTAFTTALTRREVDTAADVAAVLDWRLDPTHTRGATPGPLPWLPGIPHPLATNPYWGDYLAQRQHHVEAAASALRASVDEWTPTSAPGWARQLLTPTHRPLLQDLAVFRAAHGVAEGDTRPTGPRQQAAADRRAQVALNERVNQAVDASHRTAWTPLAVQVGLTPRSDPHWPALAENLAALSRAGADAPALIRRAAAEGPLPEEYQAAALWWRIARHVSPAVLAPDRDAAPADPLRPDWLPQLTAALGEHATATLLTDPRWPAVIAAVTRTTEHGVPLGDLLRVPVGPDGEPLPGHALADALIYRALTLTDPVPDYPADTYDLDDTHATGDAHGSYVEPEDPDLIPPPDLHMVTTLDPHAPDNLAESPLDFTHAATAAVAPLPPMDADSLCVDQVALTDAEVHEELFHAARHRLALTWEPTDEQQRRLEDRAAEAEFSPVTPERIAELNEQAAAFYQRCYPTSWAQTYLTDRLGGLDLTADPNTRPGYAPGGWTTLTSHLRRHGATDTELLGAGLAKHASSGRLIDTFRDRLILPIQHAATHRTQVVGFVGRRNPDTDHLAPGTLKGGEATAASKAGPKYLNTADTVLFAKGDQLYGMAETRDRLDNGATPVLVEGPVDALAVTYASSGHVGLAPLGTSLTDTQADTLMPFLDSTTGAPGVIVATDGDPAGQIAAERDYWILTARGADPRHATFPDGHDPASLLRQTGPAALRAQLVASRPLAETLIDERLAHLPPTTALDDAVAIIAAGDAAHWTQRTDNVSRRLHAPTEVALTQLLQHITTWDRDRHAASADQVHAVHDVRQRITAQGSLPPASRWAYLGRQVDLNLVQADDWGALAATLDRAAAAGHDLRTLLPEIIGANPLAEDEPAADLRYRLMERLGVDETPLPQSPTATARGPRGRATTVPRPNPYHPPPRDSNLRR